MTRYYIADKNDPRGYVELSAEEWAEFMGDDTTRPYAAKVYCDEISIEDVPEELRETVQALVNKKVERWGLYSERDIPSDDALDILMGGADDEA